MNRWTGDTRISTVACGLVVGLACGSFALLGGCSSDDETGAPPASVDDGPNFGVESGPCTGGASRECSIDLGTVDGVHSCFVGEQHCDDGTWGPCVEADHVHSLSHVPEHGNTCGSNPCDPECQEYDVDPMPDLVASGGTVYPYGDINGINAPWKAGGWPSPCVASPNGGEHEGQQDPCQYDSVCVEDGSPTTGMAGQRPDNSHCHDAGENCFCRPFADGEWQGDDGTPDFTMKLPCTANDEIQVCNRGDADYDGVATLWMAVSPGNSTGFGQPGPGTQTPPAFTCTCSMTGTPLAKGQCVDVIADPNSDCNGCMAGLSGQNRLVVNHPDIGPVIDEFGGIYGYNNWSHWDDNSTCFQDPYIGGSQEFDYEAQDCPQFYIPRWTFLAYDTTTPGDSSVQFQMKTSITSAGLAAESYIPVADTDFDGDTVLLSSPIDIRTILGPASQGQFMRLEITINGTSDGSDTAVVHDWAVQYTCVPGE